MTSSWKKMAAEAKAAGYIPGSRFEKMLRDSLPNRMIDELGDGLEAYLQVKVVDAENLALDMMDLETDSRTAMELAMDQLFNEAT